MICHQGSRKCRSEGVGSKKREAKMERVKGREGKKWSWRAEGSSLLQSFCYWLSGQVWMQHTGLHYWSVTTICATERRMGSVRVCEGAYMCAIYICSEMQDWICVPALGSMHIYVCVYVASLDLQREHTHSQWLIYSRGEALTPGTEPCTE